MGDAVATIYEWGGGREPFARWLNRFYDLVELEAPEIAAMFGGRVSEEHRTRVTDWWVEVMGGPAAYTERRGGYEHMLARHHDLAITAEQRLAFVTLLSRAADDAGLPADPEFRRDHGLRRVGYPTCGPQLSARSADGRTRPGAAMGVGGRAAVQARRRRLNPDRRAPASAGPAGHRVRGAEIIETISNDEPVLHHPR
jgi:hemoglobin